MAYTQQMITYEREVKEQESQYQAACAAADERYLIASNEVSKLDAPLTETKALLEKFYSADIIFPKYRNMVTMCTMYEYFMTGRCSELTGPNGAYNLYEAELRQNLIIDKLDTIVQKLDKIAQNQFTLYQELRKTNEIVTGIVNDVRTLCKTTEQIAEATTITAQCAHITAQNTEALKYITLING